MEVQQIAFLPIIKYCHAQNETQRNTQTQRNIKGGNSLLLQQAKYIIQPGIRCVHANNTFL